MLLHNNFIALIISLSISLACILTNIIYTAYIYACVTPKYQNTKIPRNSLISSQVLMDYLITSPKNQRAEPPFTESIYPFLEDYSHRLVFNPGTISSQFEYFDEHIL